MSSGRKFSRKSWTRAATLGLGCVTVLALGACGGRSTNAVSEANPLDQLFSCQHLDAELAANTLRMDDLRDERVANRLRNLTRVPGAFFGNPLSALALADPSVAIYREIDALERRNENVARMRAEKDCDGGGDTLIAVSPFAPVAEDETVEANPDEPDAAAGGLAALETKPVQQATDEPQIEPANAETPPPDESAIAAYSALLQSGAVTDKKPLEDALEAREDAETAKIETASLPERNAKEIAQIAEDIETVQRAREETRAADDAPGVLKLPSDAGKKPAE